MMFEEKFRSFVSELRSYSHAEKWIVFFAIICGFCIQAEYSVTKPTSNSIFIAHYGVALFPYVWLAIVPINLLAVTFYNRFLSLIGCFPLFLIILSITIFINTFSAIFIGDYPSFSFVLYIWKDIYILFMFQHLWSIMHSIIQIKRAKYLYGILFGFGGLGSVFGSLIPSFFAVKIGSEYLLFATIPIYAVFTFAYFFLLKKSGFLKTLAPQDKPFLNQDQKSFMEGFKLFHKSSTLKFILVIVVLMQFAVTVMDYEYNTFLENIFPDQDLRTQFSGRLWGIVNAASLLFQFIASFLLLQFIGLRKSHLLIPGILLANGIGYLLRPTFGMIIYSFSVIKTFDYSIFNIIKEMLYIPLKKDEKFKAKAIIDIFAYRSAKAFASLLILCLQACFASYLPYAFSWANIFLFSIWLIALFFFLKDQDFKKSAEII